MPDSNSATTHPGGLPGLWQLAIALCLAVVFFSYYHAASSNLRLGAGPDYASHNDVSRFLQEHHRLPKLPADEAELYFSAYGGTRALRPPLTYLVSALLAKSDPENRDERLRSYRRGSNVLAAACVALAFLAFVAWTHSVLFGLMGAALFGLWPQFSFVATYNNDDIGAIFSATLLVFALLRVWRCQQTLPSQILLGIAGGLVILTKPTAWLLLPLAVLFAGGLMITQGFVKTLKSSVIALLVAALVGGWWLVFNAINYGVDDIFLQKVTAEVAERHNRFDANQTFGYAARGIEARQLVLGNHDNFMVKTWIAVIGNLDWLRLRLGRIHYVWFSGVLLLGALAPWLISVVRLRQRTTISRVDNSQAQNWWIAWLFLAAIVFQFCLYVFANLYNDVQVQGKYLLPTLLPALLLASSSLLIIARALSQVREKNWYRRALAPWLRAPLVVPVLILGATIGMHYDALTRYVLPFYQPPAYQAPLHKLHMRSIKRVVLTPDSFARHNGIAQMRVQDAGLLLTLEGNDPWLEFKPSICKPTENHGPVRGNVMARIAIETDLKDKFAIYWDDGSGFNEQRNKNQVPFHSNSKMVYLWMGMNACRRLRLDPGQQSGSMTLKSFELIDVTIDPEYDPPFSR